MVAPHWSSRSASFPGGMYSPRNTGNWHTSIIFADLKRTWCWQNGDCIDRVYQLCILCLCCVLSLISFLPLSIFFFPSLSLSLFLSFSSIVFTFSCLAWSSFSPYNFSPPLCYPSLHSPPLSFSSSLLFFPLSLLSSFLLSLPHLPPMSTPSPLPLFPSLHPSSFFFSFLFLIIIAVGFERGLVLRWLLKYVIKSN